jgi:glycosyltransferase involved in cell wall biosynthesis
MCRANDFMCGAASASKELAGDGGDGETQKNRDFIPYLHIPPSYTPGPGLGANIPGRMTSPLVIGIDFRPALSRATGVGRYFQGLVSGLQEIDRENRYVLFSSSFKERARPEARPSNFRLVDRRVPVSILNALWHRLELPPFDWLAGSRLDIAHSPTPLRLPSRRARSIVTVCDLFFLDHPEATSREIRRDYTALVRSHARKADAILAISATTADDVAARLDVPRERIHVVHAGIDPRFLGAAPSRNGGGPPYLLAVATEEPRKNLSTLLEAFAILKGRGFDGSLRIAGGAGLDTSRVVETIARLGIEREVSRLGYVDSLELPSLYRNARALVSPSLWEGFGLPLLEAMASTTPLVASDIPVHREVAADAAVFVPPEDPEAIANGIESVWTDEALRARLAARGAARVRDFSWASSARKMLGVYRRLGNS